MRPPALLPIQSIAHQAPSLSTHRHENIMSETDGYRSATHHTYRSGAHQQWDIRGILRRSAD